MTTHIAFDAPSNTAVNDFWQASLEMGAKDNGKPGIRAEMSRQSYYAAFVIDPVGNNLEVVCVDKVGQTNANEGKWRHEMASWGV